MMRGTVVYLFHTLCYLPNLCSGGSHSNITAYTVGAVKTKSVRLCLLNNLFFALSYVVYVF